MPLFRLITLHEISSLTQKNAPSSERFQGAFIRHCLKSSANILLCGVHRNRDYCFFCRDKVALADNAQRNLLVVLGSAPELLQRRAIFCSVVAEKEIPPFVRPDAAGHPGIPAHSVPRGAVRLKVRPPYR